MSYRPEWDRLLSATQKNNVDEVIRLVEEEGVSPSHANGVGQSALHVAGLWGHVPTLKALISLGADLNVPNRITGGTPLHCVAQSTKRPIANRIECARLLMEAGANASQPDDYGGLPADYAEEDDVPESNLHESFPHIQGRSLKQVFLDGMPAQPLMEAIGRGDVEGVETQLAYLKGENKNPMALTDREGNDLVCATVNLIVGIVDGENSNDSTEDANSSSICTMMDILKALLSDGHLPTEENSDTATTVDVGKAIYTLCQTLFKVYSSPNCPSNTVTYLEGTVDILLQYDHANNHTQLHKDTPLLLHDATRRGNTKMILFLIHKLQIDVNTKGRQGLTPLHFASRSGKLDAATMLIDLGADVSAKDDRGKTPLDAALVNQKDALVELLQSKMDVESK